MSLVLYYHPLSSYCWKALVALYETGAPFEARMVDFRDADAVAELKSHWPTGKIPVLWDGARERAVAETSLIIEYLDRTCPGPAPLIPDDPDAALQARLWDRVFDLYVQGPLQKIVSDGFRPESARDAYGVDEAYGAFDTAYDLIEARMPAGDWAAGADFSLADCAALPALFYAATLREFGPDRPRLSAYFERLIARPSAARVLDEAKPWFFMYPFEERVPARFR